MSYVYRHIRLDKNEPFYIGIGSDSTYNRAYWKFRNNRIWNSIINKTKYEVEIIIDNLTWEQAQLKEKEFISLYGRKDIKTGILSNLTDGGEGTCGNVLSNKSRKKISLRLKGLKRDDKFKQRMKVRMTGNSYTTGIPLTQEHKNKIGIANKGKKKEIVECPYCKIKGGLPALKRWHFENCKNK